MLTRLNLLMSIQLKSIVRKLRYDLVSEIVVLICALVLIGLFYYIFQDFLNVKLQTVPKESQEKIARAFAVGIIAVTALFLRSTLNKQTDHEPKVAQFAARLGEPPRIVRFFRLYFNLLAQVTVFGLQWLIIHRYIYRFDFQVACLIQLVTSCFLLLPSFSQKTAARQVTQSYRPMQLPEQSCVRTLTKWRLVQMIVRRRNCQLTLILAGLTLAIVALASKLAMPAGALVLLAMLASILTAGALIFQLETDVRYAWLEKGLGVSHGQYVNAYLLAGLLLAGVFSVGAGLAVYIFWQDFDQDLIAKIALITAIGPLSVAAIMFQLDASKALLQFMSIFFICLFLGTAIYINTLFAALFPVLLYYALKYQDQQFYQLSNKSAKS